MYEGTVAISDNTDEFYKHSMEEKLKLQKDHTECDTIFMCLKMPLGMHIYVIKIYKLLLKNQENYKFQNSGETGER